MKIEDLNLKGGNNKLQSFKRNEKKTRYHEEDLIE